MNWIEQTLDDFGRSLGLGQLRWNDQGLVTLTFERSGTLSLERSDGAINILLHRAYDQLSCEQLEAALELCHWKNRQPYLVQLALHQRYQLVFVARLAEAEFTLPNVGRVFELLCHYHDKVTATPSFHSTSNSSPLMLGYSM